MLTSLLTSLGEGVGGEVGGIRAGPRKGLARVEVAVVGGQAAVADPGGGAQKGPGLTGGVAGGYSAVQFVHCR